MPGDDAVGDREAETRPALLRREEGIEDFRKLGLRDAAAAVGDRHRQHPGERRADAHGDAPSFIRRLEGVHENVQEDLF